MYNAEQQQFVERGYGILKINESHEPDDWDRLHARLSKVQGDELMENVRDFLCL